MFTFSATGEVTPPMIIYPNKRRTLEISKSSPADWGYGISDNGWMKAEVFYEYISQVLYPYLKKQNTKFPIILFVDGHSTHMTYNLSILCSQLQIILIALYPNATRILQPADVAAFKPLKNGWKKGVNEWRRSNPSQSLTKEKFAPILKLAIDNHLNRDILQNGFRTCALFPWNPDSLDYSKCLGKSTPLLRTNIQPTVKMNYETFKGIVGKELLSKFEMLFEIPENESFNKLYDMWKFFHNNNDAPDINTPKDSGQTGTTNLINSDGEGNQILTHQSANSELFDIDIANLEVVYEDSPMIINNMTDPSVCGIEMNLEKDVRPTSAIDNIETTPVKDSAKSVQTDVKIDNVLYWPVTPERKVKQNTERVPFVITAAKWQDIQCKKIEVAQDKERLKEERKRKRIENQQIRENKKKESETTKKRIENQQIRENKKKESETTKKRVIKRHCKKANVKDEAKAEAVGITRSKGIQILSDVTILPPVRTNNKEVELNKRSSNLNITRRKHECGSPVT
ncbi:DDE superfamily endonuclease [Popillia japonica]